MAHQVDSRRSKIVKIFKNGDPFAPAQKFLINPHQVHSLDNFLDNVTQETHAKEAARQIFTPSTGTRVSDLDQLENGKSYVIAGKEHFKPLDYVNIADYRLRQIMAEVKPKRPPVQHRIVKSGRSKKWALLVPKRIRILRNGDPFDQGVTMLVSKRNALSWEKFLQDISDKVKLESAVRKLYTTEGVEVFSYDDLEDGQSYVGVARLPFQKPAAPPVSPTKGPDAPNANGAPPQFSRFKSLPPIPANRPVREMTQTENSPSHGFKPHPPPPKRALTVTDIVTQAVEQNLAKKYAESNKKPTQSYNVTFNIGDGLDGEALLKVYVTLMGSKGHTRRMLLNEDDSAEHFQTNQSEIFALVADDVGDVEKLRVELESSEADPPFFLKTISIRDTSTGVKYSFPCMQWMGPAADGVRSFTVDTAGVKETLKAAPPLDISSPIQEGVENDDNEAEVTDAKHVKDNEETSEPVFPSNENELTTSTLPPLSPDPAPLSENSLLSPLDNTPDLVLKDEPNGEITSPAPRLIDVAPIDAVPQELHQIQPLADLDENTAQDENSHEPAVIIALNEALPTWEGDQVKEENLIEHPEPVESHDPDFSNVVDGVLAQDHLPDEPAVLQETLDLSPQNLELHEPAHQAEPQATEDFTESNRSDLGHNTVDPALPLSHPEDSVRPANEVANIIHTSDSEPSPVDHVVLETSVDHLQNEVPKDEATRQDAPGVVLVDPELTNSSHLETEIVPQEKDSSSPPLPLPSDDNTQKSPSEDREMGDPVLEASSNNELGDHPQEVNVSNLVEEKVVEEKVVEPVVDNPQTEPKVEQVEQNPLPETQSKKLPDDLAVPPVVESTLPAIDASDNQSNEVGLDESMVEVSQPPADQQLHEPILQTEESVLQTEEPVLQTEEPILQTEEHVLQTEEPVLQTEEHVLQTEEPVLQTEEPVVQTDESVLQTDESVLQTEEPVLQTEEPVLQTEEPVQTDELILDTIHHQIEGSNPDLELNSPAILPETVSSNPEVGEDKKEMHVADPINTDANEAEAIKDSLVVEDTKLPVVEAVHPNLTLESTMEPIVPQSDEQPQSNQLDLGSSERAVPNEPVHVEESNPASEVSPEKRADETAEESMLNDSLEVVVRPRDPEVHAEKTGVDQVERDEENDDSQNDPSQASIVSRPPLEDGLDPSLESANHESDQNNQSVIQEPNEEISSPDQ